MLSAPLNVRLQRTGMSGQVQLRFQPVYGAFGGFNVQTATSSDGPFTDYASFSTTRNVLITAALP